MIHLNIELKMKELGVMGQVEQDRFKILAYVDYTAMISVTTEKVKHTQPHPNKHFSTLHF